MRPLTSGDYVLATKYRDGDPSDGYAVGFFDSMLSKISQDRFMVVDAAGKQYRGNGFRRCERISYDLGNWIVANRMAIEALTRIAPINMWRYRKAAARVHLEGLLGESFFEAYHDQIKREAARFAEVLPQPQDGRDV